MNKDNRPARPARTLRSRSAEQIKAELNVEIVYEAEEAGKTNLVNAGKLLLPRDSDLYAAFMLAEVRYFDDASSDRHALIPLETQYGRVYLRKVVLKLDCDGCGAVSANNYMVNHDLWRQVVPEVRGMLCMRCFETKLGRRLRAEDFLPDAPINRRHLAGFD